MNETAEDIKQLVACRSYTLRNAGIVALRTTLYAFQCAAMLNRLYGWRLRRDMDFTVNDMGGHGDQLCPFFFHLDETTRLLYFLVDTPPAQGIDPTLDIYDKLLVINGDNAYEPMRRLYDDFTQTARRDMSHADETERRQERMRVDMAKNDIIAADFIDFSRCDDADHNEYGLTNIQSISLSSKSAAIYAHPGDKDQYERERKKGMTLSAQGGDEAALRSLQKARTSLFDVRDAAIRLQASRKRALEQQMDQFYKLKDTANHLLGAIESAMVV